MFGITSFSCSLFLSIALVVVINSSCSQLLSCSYLNLQGLGFFPLDSPHHWEESSERMAVWYLVVGWG